MTGSKPVTDERALSARLFTLLCAVLVWTGQSGWAATPPAHVLGVASNAASRQDISSNTATGLGIPSIPAIPSQSAARGAESLDDKQKLGLGDRISFRVLEDQEPSKPLTITDAGELDVPELGLVEAKGKTCRQLAMEVESRLEQTTYYRATVIIGIESLNKTMSGRKVYVVGQVRQAGPQEIPAGENWTVSKAIMKAGGFTEFGDKKKVRLVRAGDERAGKVQVVNVSEIWEGKTEKDLAVEPEDLIYVPARAINFY